MHIFKKALSVAIGAAIMFHTGNVLAQDIVQKPETLFYNNEVYLLYTYPIDQNAELYNKIKRVYKLKSENGVARGYIGRWSIVEDAVNPDQELLALNYLEYFHGSGTKLKTDFVKSEDLKGFQHYPIWVNGVYSAERESSHEKGTFTFKEGRLVKTTFRVGHCVFPGQPAEVTQHQLTNHLRSRFPDVDGSFLLSAHYDGFGTSDTPADLKIDVSEQTGQMNDNFILSEVLAETRRYLMSNKCMPLYSVNLKESPSSDVQHLKMKTHENEFVVDLTRQSPVSAPVSTFAPTAPTAPAASPVSVTDSMTGAQVKHTVKPGETLFSIARRYKTTVNAIMRLNPSMKNADRVQAGQTIVVK